MEADVTLLREASSFPDRHGACATAHRWARTLMAAGHDARLIPRGYIKPYLRRQKNDAAGAAVICEAVTRPSMRFVPVKSGANRRR